MKHMSGLAAELPSAHDHVWKITPAQWALIALAGAAGIAAFLPGLRFMVQNWEQVEEYSYGYFIPLISAFLVWQKSDQLRALDLRGSWSGLVLIGAAVVLAVIGQFSAIRLFAQYGFLVAVFGLSVCCIGWRGTRVIAVPLGILFFMIPLPQFLLRELSEDLQLLSSQIGVALIRAFGISVFLEGNVIDLGSYKLQVVEACSGLRYLFPLMVLGFLAAYFFQGAWWKRALIVLSTIPLTILINSLRIAIIGYTVEHWGSSMAEGLLHDFEGWFMFMVCVVLLVAEMAVLARNRRTDRCPCGQRLGSNTRHASTQACRATTALCPRPLVAGAIVLGLVRRHGLLDAGSRAGQPSAYAVREFPAGPARRLDRTRRPTRSRRGLRPWPSTTICWSTTRAPAGRRSTSTAPGTTARAAAHRRIPPRTCMPGGGWKIVELEDTPVQFAEVGTAVPTSRVLNVNRAVIQKGEQRQLVYYWFRQRGRELTNEMSVKWFILHDAIARDRSDGALVRLVTPVAPTESIAGADRRLTDFLGTIDTRLVDHVPD